MVAVHALAHIAVYAAVDPREYGRASSIANLSGAFAMAILPWLIHGYFRTRSKLVPSVMTAFYVSIGCVYEIIPIGPFARSSLDLDRIALPWGELATIHRLDSVPIALLLFWSANFLFLGHLAVVCARRWRPGARRHVLEMVVGISVVMLTLASNMLVMTNHLDMIFLGEFGFLPLLLTMAKLLSGEQSYRAVVAQAAAGIFVTSPEGQLLDVNRMACAIVGSKRGELLKLRLADLEVAGEQSWASLRIADDRDAPPRSTRKLRRHNGATLLVEVSAQRLDDGRIVYMVSDITESQRLESAVRLLAESGPQQQPEQFFDRCVAELAAVFGVRHGSVGLLDAGGELVRVVSRWPRNDATLPARYSIAAAPGARLKTSPAALHVRDAAREFPEHSLFAGAAVAGYLGAGIVSTSGKLIGVLELWDEQPFVAGAESLRILEMFAHRIGAEVERAASEAELRELMLTLETRIAERTAELAAANEELEAFSYTVSHDLRTPVRAISGDAHMLLDESGDQLSAAARTRVQRILQSVQRMRELIEGLLTIARLSHQPQNIEEVDLSRLAAAVIDQLRERDPAREVEFVCVPSAIVDADQVSAGVLMTNLIENAWKYSAKAPHARIEFGCELQQDERVFFVRDNGAGFDMQRAKRLFEPFARLHDAKDYPGCGVGLASVERVVRRHSGRVWAVSAPDEGATFYFTLGYASHRASKMDAARAIGAACATS